MAAQTQWEYKRVTGFIWNEMSILNEMGREGWQLCAVWGPLMYFRRPIAGR